MTRGQEQSIPRPLNEAGWGEMRQRKRKGSLIPPTKAPKLTRRKGKKEKKKMEVKAIAFGGSSRGLSSASSASFITSTVKRREKPPPPTFSPLLIHSMATQKPTLPPASKTISSRKASTVFPLGEKGPRSSPLATPPPIKLLTRVEQLKLLTKAEKAGLLSAAEKYGFSLSSIEKLGLLSKAEEFGILSAATDPGTPGALLSLSLVLLLLGPSCAFLVPEDYPWEVALQLVVALVCVVGGSAAFAASNLVSNLQKLK
ncbi:uncharacterized protein LOC100243309 [Vitis vinifera]|uniref:Uncharacterized protein n=2 Tax=Vitis vinifera TaxID=29760 RepID=F6GTD1_VITVI|nr:uncharacterized protein LOC100243309 [Vitis vinifera]|eukprot:XP_002265727.3 PREDICTED: uncharacterized protein LOC100243309 [Vitis vinifera]